MRVDGAVIFAAERPSQTPGGPCLVLIHGAGVTHRDWTFRFVKNAPPHWRILAFDRPGHGASSRPPGAAAALPAAQARLLRQAAAALGAEQAIVAGHSWGGAVAMAWALDAPQSVLGAASLAGAVAPWSFRRALDHGRLAAAAAAGGGGGEATGRRALETAFSPAALPQGYAAHLQEAPPTAGGRTGPFWANAADVSAINGALALQAPRYRSLRRPVALIYGAKDALLSAAEQGEAAAAALPDATLTVLPDAGHMLHQTHGRACWDTLQSLAERAEAAPPAPLARDP